MAMRNLLELPELTEEEDFALSLLSPKGFKEIGDLLGLPRQTVQMIMIRALKKMRKAAGRDWASAADSEPGGDSGYFHGPTTTNRGSRTPKRGGAW